MTSTFTLSAPLEKTTSGYHFIVIPEDIAQQIVTKDSKRVRCVLNDDTVMHCQLNFSPAEGYKVNISKRQFKALGLVAGSEVQVQIAHDDSPYQAPMPEELQEVLDTDPEGFQRFQALTPGKQRSIIFKVASGKTIDTRINRSLRVMEKLKMGITDLKQLM
ncbi:hypothetical protein BKI52_27900 [marine bacterium AO1-C]|nr:hypothetical protein BKI52_27900 [marine bacterium AO1-C]